MALTPASQQQAVERTAPHFTNKFLASSVRKAAKEGLYEREFCLINRLVDRVNTLRADKNDGLPKAPDIRSSYDKKFPFSELPQLFAWNSHEQNLDWTRHLLKTLDTMNQEIGIGLTYSNPKVKHETEGMTSQDAFRWFLLDGYCRWFAGLQTNHEVAALEEERNIADVICFSFCEAAVILAEKGEQDMRELVGWMLHWGWIKTGPEYNLTPELVERARQVVHK